MPTIDADAPEVPLEKMKQLFGKKVAQLGADSAFGEQAVMEVGTKRNATVVAADDLYVVTVTDTMYRRVCYSVIAVVVAGLGMTVCPELTPYTPRG